MKNQLNKLLLGLALLLLASCNHDTVYNQSKTLPEGGWHKDSAAVFNVPITDVNTPYRLIINVRNRGDYKTQNLWLFVSYQRPDKSIKKDTVECYLANNDGRWLGSGFGSMYEMPVLFVPKIKFTKPGNYKFSIAHGMRDISLVGINDIGLEVIKAK
jgi:gliding motility-associated lipoprotein GldH